MNIRTTIRRLELLLDSIELKESDETSYNELEFILKELKDLSKKSVDIV